MSLSSADCLAIHNKYAWELQDLWVSGLKMEYANRYSRLRKRSPVYSEADFLSLKEREEDILRRRREELEPEPKRTIYRGELI